MGLSRLLSETSNTSNILKLFSTILGLFCQHISGFVFEVVLSLNYEAEHVTCNLQVVIGCLCPFNVAVYVKTTRIYKKKMSIFDRVPIAAIPSQIQKLMRGNRLL